jgi:3-oxoacyl-[acyl-carrier-protein] synthase-3
VGATAILGIGHCIPPRTVTNEELAGQLDLDAAVIATRTGIALRHYIEPGFGPSDLALEASAQALGQAGLDADDLDFLLFATMTPDIAFPGAGCLLQDKLGVSPIGALDIRAQCAGFVFGLLVADRFIQAGTYERVLVAVAEVQSTALDFSPRGAGVTPFFGDGGAVAIVGKGAEGRGVLAGLMRTDATDYEQFWCEYPAGRQHPVRMTIEDLRRGLHHPQLDLDALNPIAIRHFREAVGDVVERSGCRADGIAHYFFNYVHPPTALEAAEGMGIASTRVTATSSAAGHMGGASLPIGLSQAVEAGTVGSGDVVCLAAVGAGINWGAVLLRL